MKNAKPKERIMGAVSVLFREQGFNSTGVNQIIRQSDVAKASFYDNFKTKDALVIEYLNQRHHSWFAGLTAAVKKGETLNEKIIQSFLYLKKMNEQENFSGCVFLNILSELKFENEKVHQIIKNHKSDLQNFFKKMIKDKDKALLIYMLFESCLIESQVYRSQEIIEKTIKLLKKNRV